MMREAPNQSDNQPTKTRAREELQADLVERVAAAMKPRLFQLYPNGQSAAHSRARIAARAAIEALTTADFERARELLRPTQSPEGEMPPRHGRFSCGGEYLSPRPREGDLADALKLLRLFADYSPALQTAAVMANLQRQAKTVLAQVAALPPAPTAGQAGGERDLGAQLRDFEGSDALGNGDFSVCTRAADALDAAREAFLAMIADADRYEAEYDGDETGGRFSYHLSTGSGFEDLAEALGVPPPGYMEGWADAIDRAVAAPAKEPSR